MQHRPSQRASSAEERAEWGQRAWAIAAHLAGLLSVPAPLLIWLIKRRQDAVIEQHARESLNFQISIFIYLVISAFLTMPLIGFILLPLVIVFDLAMVVTAAIRTGLGHPWRYPLCLRLVSGVNA